MRVPLSVPRFKIPVGGADIVVAVAYFNAVPRNSERSAGGA